MKKLARTVSFDYSGLLREVKSRIQHAQSRAVLAANAELIRLYWDLGRIIDARQKEEGYGTAVIPRLAVDLHNELPDEKGFSERNIKRMLALFFAYLPDWPDKLLTFDAEGNLTPREESYTFSNVFICMPSEGAVEIIARGGKKVQMPLRKAFCRAVMGLEVDDDDPVRATYYLDHLLDPAFAFTTRPEDRVAAVFLRRVRLVPNVYVPAVEYIEPKFTEGASRAEVLAAVASLRGAYNLDRSQVSVAQVGIQLQFMSDGQRKAKTMTFNVSCPNTCDLKSKPDDVRVVGERLIRSWGILRD